MNIFKHVRFYSLAHATNLKIRQYASDKLSALKIAGVFNTLIRATYYKFYWKIRIFSQNIDHHHQFEGLKSWFGPPGSEYGSYI